MPFLIKQIEKELKLNQQYTIKAFKEGEIILNAEDELNAVFVLKHGTLKTYSLSENGLKHLVRVYERGGLLGDIEIFTDRAVVCYVEAMQAGEMYIIKREEFLSWMQRDFNISLYITKQLAQKVYDTGLKMQSSINYPLKYQVLFYIWKHIRQYSSRTIPKLLIVEELGSNIRSINRILKQLSEQDVIVNLNGEIEVPDSNKVLALISHYDHVAGKK